MIPTSTRDIDRFCPSSAPADPSNAETVPGQLDGSAGDSRPTYLIKPASALERRRWRRDVHATGARWPADAEMYAALRAAVVHLAPANLAFLLDLIEQAESIAAGGDPAPAPLDEAQALALRALEETVLAADPFYAALRAARVYWIEVAPWVAARHFLVGWENVSVPFARSNGLVADDLLEQLPEEDVVAAGWRAVALMRPGDRERKNSASPPPSRCAQPISPAASAPPTAAPGSYGGNGSSATRA